MSDVPAVDRPLHIDGAPEVVRNERRWPAHMEGGEAVVLAQLLPELAEDESLRRRYVYEAERLAATKNESLAEVLAIGPAPDPRSMAAAAPWRLRREPAGTRLDRVLSTRAPMPVDEVVDVLTRLAQAVHSLHEAGLVLRDLEPKSVVRADDGALFITDVGLARIDILSSRTASSLMLESSAYAAPEHLRATVVDARADVYTLAAIAWHALTGVVPYDDGSPFLRDYGALPDLQALCPAAPAGLDGLLQSCLSEHPDDRPNSAEELVHILQGHGVPGSRAVERVRCQSCGEELRLGMRLCLHCGKSAVQFHKADEGPGYSVVLRKAKEDKEFVARLRRFFEDVGEGPPPELNFLIGDQRMYSKAERKSRTKLPVALLSGLSKESARALTRRLQAENFNVEVKRGQVLSSRRNAAKRMMIAGLVSGATLFVTLAALAGLPVLPSALVGLGFGGLLVGIGAIMRYRGRRDEPRTLAQLRAGPAALPASDPFVARIAGLLSQDLASDVREQVSELALLVQRLCDHRAQAADESGALEMLMEPLDRLVTVICEEVESLRSIDSELAELDEGNLIRAITTSEARGEDRSRRSLYLQGLDRMRELEDRRAMHLGSLLQAATLLERIANLGLSEVDAKLLENNRITMALAALGET